MTHETHPTFQEIRTNPDGTIRASRLWCDEHNVVVKDWEDAVIQIRVRPGATIQGVTYFYPALLDVSRNYAEAIIERGDADAVER